MRIEHSKSWGGKTPQSSIFICSPSYSGDFNCHFLTSLLQTCDLLKKEGILYEVYFSVYDSLVARSRNDLADRFLKSNCTHILMIDSDQGWDSKAVPAMLKLDKDFITGAVPARKVTEEYALKINTNTDRTPKVNHEGLIECTSNGVAFAMIKRCVFEKLKTTKFYKSEVYPYFQHRYYEDGGHYGEDTYFIKNWTKLGDLWIYPDITFTHGPITANYHEFLCRQPGGSEDESLSNGLRI